MPKSHPRIISFLNHLTDAVDYIGKPELARQIRMAYRDKKQPINQKQIIELLVDELDDLQLKLPL